MARPHEVAYPTLSPDTAPDVERVQIEVYRRMPAWRKVELVDDAIELSRQLAFAGVRARHPHASPEELRRRFLGIWVGEDLASEAWGPLPEDRSAPHR